MTIYRWGVLPFGANVSPYYFAKFISSLIGHFRQQNLHIDIEKQRDQVLNEFRKFGFLVNFEKSCLVLSNKVKYIGYGIKTQTTPNKIQLTIPRERIRKVQRDIKRATKHEKMTAKVSC